MLFEGVEPDDLGTLLSCLSASFQSHTKGNVIWLADSPAEGIGVVLRGQVDIQQIDYWGHQSLLARLSPGDLFGEAFAFSGLSTIPVEVTAATPCDVLLLQAGRMLKTCGKNCRFHAQLLENMLRILAQKNVTLTEKMAYVTRRTTREKLLAYLSAHATRAGSDTFDIPLNRQALADFLAVDRSALSTELGKLQREGILTFHKNHFTLLKITDRSF